MLLNTLIQLHDTISFSFFCLHFSSVFFLSLSLSHLIWHLVNLRKQREKYFIRTLSWLPSFWRPFCLCSSDDVLLLPSAIVNLVLILSDIFLSCSVYILHFPEAPRKSNASHATPISVLKSLMIFIAFVVAVTNSVLL